MTPVVVTYTVIHVASAEFAPLPYGVVILDTDAGRVAARADGELAWLRIGAAALLEEDDRFGMRCLAWGKPGFPHEPPPLPQSRSTRV